MSFQAVQLQIQDHYVVIDNGILQMTISNPGGIVTKIMYNGIENLLEETNEEDIRGIAATSFSVVVEHDEMVEVSFSRTWDASAKGKLVPLNIDKRFIVLQGSSGFYSYAIYEKLKEWPGFNLPQTRIVFKLNKQWFRYMVVADDRQRDMPLPDDRLPGRCQTLAFPEAVLLTNPVEPEFKGEVDDKYQYSCENKDLQVQGWICKDPPTGFWQITPSDEFRSGGPLKQNLTSHVGPTNLAMFISAHYAGEDMVMKFADGEPWKKVFGPVFMYLNGLPTGFDWNWLWEDAKEQLFTETESWPYSFPASEDFPTSDQRGNLSGRLLVCDSYSDEDYTSAVGAYVGLASSSEVDSWQLQSKGYQFWTKADENGYFCINDIRPGDYDLYAWVPGFIGDFRSDSSVSLTAGRCAMDMGDIVYKPPRDGPTMWEIGFPDRTAREFYVPDPDPNYVNKLYLNHPDRFRQYGLWDRYTELYPNDDLIYTVGVSDFQKDWFFAQVTRKKDNTYIGTTWQIRFKLENVNQNGVYKLRLALAMANQAELQVRVNNPIADPPVFSTGLIGHDNAIARHGIHGLYRLYTADIEGVKLVQGDNTVFLTQSKGGSPLVGIMYDYIRLEVPPESD
ncbi:hypothetical protein KSS87_005540 [Heliosperma pusillum]|nr:hypothetical protein KSS87_005540 [Heliosperma pusillum]